MDNPIDNSFFGSDTNTGISNSVSRTASVEVLMCNYSLYILLPKHVRMYNPTSRLSVLKHCWL